MTPSQPGTKHFCDLLRKTSVTGHGGPLDATVGRAAQIATFASNVLPRMRTPPTEDLATANRPSCNGALRLSGARAL